MALRHRKKANKLNGEPIYPIGYICEHPGCHKAGKRFEVDNFIAWFCKNHQKDLPVSLFTTFELYPYGKRG